MLKGPVGPDEDSRAVAFACFRAGLNGTVHLRGEQLRAAHCPGALVVGPDHELARRGLNGAVTGLLPGGGGDRVVAAVNRLRAEPLAKPPGVAETVEWAEAATVLHEQGAAWPVAFRRAIGVALKDQDDMVFMADRLDGILEEAAA